MLYYFVSFKRQKVILTYAYIVLKLTVTRFIILYY